jgi:hypothetical protein
MEMFNVTEEVFGDYGVLTLDSPGYQVTEQYDLSAADYARALMVLVGKHIAMVYANNL